MGLSGAQLIIGAVIFAEHKRGYKYYGKGIDLLVDWCGLSKSKVQRELKKMQLQGILERKFMHINGERRMCYRLKYDTNW